MALYCYIVPLKYRRTQDFTTDGVHVVGSRARESVGRKSPVESRGKAPVGGLGDFVPPEAEAKCELAYNF